MGSHWGGGGDLREGPDNRLYTEIASPARSIWWGCEVEGRPDASHSYDCLRGCNQ